VSAPLAVQRPADKLVAWAQANAAHHLEKRPEIVLAQAAAEGAAGVVITTEADAMMAAERTAAVAAGAKAVAAAKKEALHVPAVMADAVKDLFLPIETRLRTAKAALDEANKDYIRRRREAAEREAEERQREAVRVAEEERRRQEQVTKEAREMALAAGAPPEAADAAAQAAADAATSMGEAVPLDFAAPDGRDMFQVRSGSVVQTMTKRLAAEIANVAEIDPSLVELRTKPALDYGRRAMRLEKMPEPGIGRDKSVVYQGIRYWYEEGIATR
jgi:hypothetical protein